MNPIENNVLWGCIEGIIMNVTLHRLNLEEGGTDTVNRGNILDIIASPVSLLGFCGGGLGILIGQQLMEAPLGAFTTAGMSLVGVIVFNKFLSF